MQTPYEELIRQIGLKDHHREELKQKRGFSDETIERLKYRSDDPKIVT